MDGQRGFMQFRPIRCEADYKSMLAEVSTIIDLTPEIETQDGERLEVLALLVEAYEDKHFPIPVPSPLEAIKFRMDQGGMTVPDMAPYLGDPQCVQDVLSGSRPLTLEMIQRLRKLGISEEVLLGSCD